MKAVALTDLCGRDGLDPNTRVIVSACFPLARLVPIQMPASRPNLLTFASCSIVPESVLKKRRTVEQVKAKRAAKAVAEKVHRKKVRQIAFKSAEKYVKEYRQVRARYVPCLIRSQSVC